MNANKGLIALVIGMGVIILLGLVALAVGITMRARDPSFSLFAKVPARSLATSAPGDLAVPIPPDASVVSIVRDGDLLMVHLVDEDDVSTLLFVDPIDGHIVRRISFSAEK